MPLIKPRTRGKQLVRHITRLDRENNETLFAYAHFLGEPTDYVLNQLIDTVLAKDKEFLAWRTEHPQSHVPRSHRAAAGRETSRAGAPVRRRAPPGLRGRVVTAGQVRFTRRRGRRWCARFWSGAACWRWWPGAVSARGGCTPIPSPPTTCFCASSRCGRPSCMACSSTGTRPCG